MDLDPTQGQSLNQDLTKSTASLSSSISRLSRSSRAVPSDKDFHFFHNFEEFRAPVKEIAAASQAMLQMIGSSADIWGREMAYPEDADEGYEWVVDGNDEAYDRFDAAAEEFRGLRLKQEQSRIDSGDGFQLVCGRKKKWGQSEMGQDSTVVAHSNVALAVKDKRTVGPAARPRVPFHIPTIPRPQDEFNILVNNSNQPFQHVWLQRSDDGLRFIHPLEELSLLDFLDKNIGDLMPVMPPSIEDTPFKLVEEVRDLKELAAKLRSVNEFAVDLEHNQYRSFQGLTCLMQISTRTEDFVVDTLKLRIHVGPYLREVFKDPTKKKVMHGADRDIVWLQRDFGIYICNMFDTGQASRVLKLERNSLEHLLHHYCGVTANKEYQNADWRLRPLPDEMLRYAREDTHYLLHIYDLMRTQLLSMAEPENSNALLLEVYKRSFDICMQLYEKELLTDSSYLYTYGLQGAHFNAQQLAIVAGLFEWRDVVARAEDESTGYILPNKTLLEIAKQMPVTTSKLRRLLKSKHPYVERNLGPVVSIIRHSILNAAAFEAAAQHLKAGHIGTASEDNTADTTGFEALPPESPTSIRATDARAESFDTDNVINGGTTDKLQTFVSAKEYHMEPGSTIDGPGSKGRGGSSEPPGESKEVKDEKDSFIPEVPRETPSVQARVETRTLIQVCCRVRRLWITTSYNLCFVYFLEMNSINFFPIYVKFLISFFQVTEVTVQLLKKPNRAFGALLGKSASKRKLNSDPKVSFLQ
ncbi:hypothetical protein PVL29_009586 [Vitis rotundifolia]|uniref:HRDC domain-containing protein n=1 Tax=Vitis rotundifolia TaxID=103349 RepID=A0AA38ZSS8_VITRO|nr:hypothetical protein PVL29_009586 [Vitis rotundifolia]